MERKDKQLARIEKNEKRLDEILLSVKKLEEALQEFKAHQKDITLLNQYYGSQNWLQDKEDFENSKIPRIKAGVLSEDAVWNLNEEIRSLREEMKS